MLQGRAPHTRTAVALSGLLKLGTFGSHSYPAPSARAGAGADASSPSTTCLLGLQCKMKGCLRCNGDTSLCQECEPENIDGPDRYASRYPADGGKKCVRVRTASGGGRALSGRAGMRDAPHHPATAQRFCCVLFCM